jgi:hypothetical protein
MKTYGRDDILRFLAEIDEQLFAPAAIEIIGGAAALLAYGATSPTKNIDSFLNIDHQIQQAASRTTQKIPLDRAAIADPPYNYEDRRRPLDLPFRYLTVWVPEKHDILLMKTVRAMRHDEEVLQEMHHAEPFNLDIIVERYNTEMGQAIGDHNILDQKIALIVEKLFGGRSTRRFGKRKAH